MFLSNKLVSSGLPNPLYSDDVFASNTFTASGGVDTIVNGIDLLNKGGLVILKRLDAAEDPIWIDSSRGVGFILSSASTNPSVSSANYITSFNNNGFSTGTSLVSGAQYLALTFRKSTKFFDIVTYSGNNSGRSIPHNLNAIPELIFFKCTNGGGFNWAAYISGGYAGYPNLSNAIDVPGTWWNNLTPTSTSFPLGADAAGNVNASGGFNYIAYLFANDTSSNSIIKSGIYVGNGSASGTLKNLGWEPSFLLVKSLGVGNWYVMESGREFTYDGVNKTIKLNSSAIEASQTCIGIRSNGFVPSTTSTEFNENGQLYQYVAIRRSTKPPTSPSDVFKVQSNVSSSGYSAFNLPYSANKVDLLIHAKRSGDSKNWQFVDRVRGIKNMTASYPTGTNYLSSSSANPESSSSSVVYQRKGLAGYEDFISIIEQSSANYIDIGFKRATGFFDIVGYTGDGTSTQVVPHNLGTIPQFAIIKKRDGAVSDWQSAVNPTDLSGWSGSYRILFNWNDAPYSNTGMFNPATNTTFVPYQAQDVIASAKYIAYLFASVPGICKIGTYVGNSTGRTINCGFSSGAQFVVIRRLDGIGDWMVFDSARGMAPGTNPVMYFNSGAGENTTYGDVATWSSVGFFLSGSAPVNVSGESYMYLAISA